MKKQRNSAILQAGRKAAWINKNGECVFGYEAYRECAEEYQADLSRRSLIRRRGGFHDYADYRPRKHMAIDCMVHRYAIAARTEESERS